MFVHARLRARAVTLALCLQSSMLYRKDPFWDADWLVPWTTSSHIWSTVNCPKFSGKTTNIAKICKNCKNYATVSTYTTAYVDVFVLSSTRSLLASECWFLWPDMSETNWHISRSSLIRQMGVGAICDIDIEHQRPAGLFTRSTSLHTMLQLWRRSRSTSVHSTTSTPMTPTSTSSPAKRSSPREYRPLSVAQTPYTTGCRTAAFPLTYRSRRSSSSVSQARYTKNVTTINVTGAPIALSPSIKSLGVTLDLHVTLDDHVTAVSKVCYFHICALRDIHASIPNNVVNMITCMIVGSRLDYCNSLLAGMSEANFAKLQCVQNTLARVLTGSRRYDRVKQEVTHMTPVQPICTGCQWRHR